MTQDGPIADNEYRVEVIKLRKGTFSCWECKRRKKRCIPSADTTSDICSSCERLGCPCIGQQYTQQADDSIEYLQQRIARVERLAHSVVNRRRRQHHRVSRHGTLYGPLTGAGEDRLSRCRSLTSYFYVRLVL